MTISGAIGKIEKILAIVMAVAMFAMVGYMMYNGFSGGFSDDGEFENMFELVRKFMIGFFVCFGVMVVLQVLKVMFRKREAPTQPYRYVNALEEERRGADRCGNCGAAVSGNERYCPECGVRISDIR